MNHMRILINIVETAFHEVVSNQVVNESLTSAAPYKWISTTATTHSAQFKAGEIHFIVTFVKSQHGWHMSFRPKKTLKDKVSMIVPSQKAWDSSFGITGSGMQFAVISTVMKIAFEFIKQNRPNMLIFSAREPSRDKLYQAILARHQADLAAIGYKPIVGQRESGELMRNFYIIRNDHIP